MRWIVLLRAVNVGGARSVPMEALRHLIGEAGGTDVRTYIQSGNVAFDQDGTPDAADLQARLHARFGFEVPVVVRPQATLAAWPERHPLDDGTAAPQHVHVGFVLQPDAARLRSFDAARYLPERLAPLGDDLALLLPNGVGKARLTTAVLDRATGSVVTVRNWATVNALRTL